MVLCGAQYQLCADESIDFHNFEQGNYFISVHYYATVNLAHFK